MNNGYTVASTLQEARVGRVVLTIALIAFAGGAATGGAVVSLLGAAAVAAPECRSGSGDSTCSVAASDVVPKDLLLESPTADEPAPAGWRTADGVLTSRVGYVAPARPDKDVAGELPDALEAPVPALAAAASDALLGRRAAADELPVDAMRAADPEPDPSAADLASILPAKFAAVVKPGDTLSNILQRAGLDQIETHEVVSFLSEQFDPRRLQPGQPLDLVLASAEVAPQARLQSLSLGIDAESDLHLRRAEDGLVVETVLHPLSRETASASARIDSSVYEAAISSGMPLEVFSEILKLFSWDVDFQRDVHPGNSIEAVYDRLVAENGSVVRGGDLEFAALHLDGRTIEAYRYERSDGTVGFYDSRGRSLRKWLLRTPVDGARLSSGFGMRRHPVLGYSRMHKGVDFAAPTGTPIYAAGDGTIEFAGRNKGYGRYVEIRHNGEYSTAYGHLSRIAKGLSHGRRVHQGDVIGYVGSSGLATGPHLHYEVLKNGVQVNPLGVKLTGSDELAAEEMPGFRARRVEIDAQRPRPVTRKSIVAQRGVISFTGRP